jgi:hypothetical protein
VRGLTAARKAAARAHCGSSRSTYIIYAARRPGPISTHWAHSQRLRRSGRHDRHSG